MKKKEYPSLKLFEVNPEKIITKTKDNALKAFENFFLITASFLHDISSINHYYKLVNESHEEPPKELSSKYGLFVQLESYTKKIMISTIFEYKNYLERLGKKDFFTTNIHFLTFTKNYKQYHGNQKSLENIIDLARVDSSDEFIKKIKNIRNKIGFHYQYDNNEKIIREGFQDFFFNKKSKQEGWKDKALYSIDIKEGQTFTGMSFHYVDASFSKEINEIFKEFLNSWVDIAPSICVHPLNILNFYLSKKGGKEKMEI